jgi:hypothetical protein
MTVPSRDKAPFLQNAPNGTRMARAAKGREGVSDGACAKPASKPARKPALKARAGARKAAKKPASGAKPKALVQRIYNTIDGELTKLEEQTGTSSQDRERASRALSQMVSSLEKAVDMQREIAKSSSAGSRLKQKEALAHAEDLRREIAERLERLNRRRTPGKRSQ